MAINWQDARWRKSLYSDSGGCVEVAYAEETVGVRDTKANGHGPILEFTEHEWTAFLKGAAAGEFTFQALSK